MEYAIVKVNGESAGEILTAGMSFLIVTFLVAVSKVQTAELEFVITRLVS